MDITDIRANNIKQVISTLRFRDDLTKKEVAQITGLSFSTVSNICNALKEKNVLRIEKTPVSGVGRVPYKSVFRYGMFCSLCLDLQVENVLGFAVLDFRNNILFQNSYDILACTTPRDVLLQARHRYDQVAGYDWFKQIQCVGVGIAVSGVVDRISGNLINCSVPMMQGADLVELVDEIFDMKGYVDSESHFCSLSMHQQHRDVKDLVYLHIAQNIGLGVICNGELIRGKNGYAADISHIPLGNPTKICSCCERKGCIETDLSLNGLLEAFEADNQELTNLQRWERKAHAINDSQEEFQSFLKEKGTVLGSVLSLLIHMFDPEEIYVGGSISLIYEKLLPYVIAVIEQQCLFTLEKMPKLISDLESSNTIYCGINQVIFDKWNPLEENRL
ncbi:ROK family transcriptional regulator [Desulfocicer niacini]